MGLLLGPNKMLFRQCDMHLSDIKVSLRTSRMQMQMTSPVSQALIAGGGALAG
jgi:hypothetical protein